MKIRMLRLQKKKLKRKKETEQKTMESGSSKKNETFFTAALTLAVGQGPQNTSQRSMGRVSCYENNPSPEFRKESRNPTQPGNRFHPCNEAGWLPNQLDSLHDYFKLKTLIFWKKKFFFSSQLCPALPNSKSRKINFKIRGNRK